MADSTCAWCGVRPAETSTRVYFAPPSRWSYVLALVALPVAGLVALLRFIARRRTKVPVCGQCQRSFTRQMLVPRLWLLFAVLGGALGPIVVLGFDTGLSREHLHTSLTVLRAFDALVIILGTAMAIRALRRFEPTETIVTKAFSRSILFRLGPLTWALYLGALVLHIGIAVPRDYLWVPPGHAVVLEHNAELIASELDYRSGHDAFLRRRGFDALPRTASSPGDFGRGSYGAFSEVVAEALSGSGPCAYGRWSAVEYLLDEERRLLCVHIDEYGSGEYFLMVTKYRVGPEFEKLESERRDIGQITYIAVTAIHVVGAFFPGPYFVALAVHFVAGGLK